MVVNYPYLYEWQWRKREFLILWMSICAFPLLYIQNNKRLPLPKFKSDTMLSWLTFIHWDSICHDFLYKEKHMSWPIRISPYWKCTISCKIQPYYKLCEYNNLSLSTCLLNWLSKIYSVQQHPGTCIFVTQFNCFEITTSTFVYCIPTSALITINVKTVLCYAFKIIKKLKIISV
jgi:hypothetical protein